VYQHTYSVWRDPVLKDIDDNPLCDSCHSLNRTPQDEFHLCDFILVEEKVVNPEVTTCLVWRVARIVQLDGDKATVQLLERYSTRAKIQKRETYVSEVRPISYAVYSC
jgi:hypothetical protein